MDVGVWDLETGDDVASPGDVEALDDRGAHHLSDLVQMRPAPLVQIRPEVNLIDWNHQYMAIYQRLNGEECRCFVIPPDESSRQFTVDDLREYAAHTCTG